jgi:hypothetical protein
LEARAFSRGRAVESDAGLYFVELITQYGTVACKVIGE